MKLGNNSRVVIWIKKIGFWGFMFFLLKGLVWVAIFTYGYFAVK